MSKAMELLPQLCDEDKLIPTIRVLIMLGKDVLMNKIVSKKAKIREILVANNLDPEKTYLLDQQIIDVDKTILEIVPKSKAHLTAADLIIEIAPLDLDFKHEIRYDPVLKPIEKPFRLLTFHPKNYILTEQRYSDKSIKNLKLDDFSDSYAYCNTNKSLFISGGKKGNFWKVDKQNLCIEALPRIKSPKENHTMFFVPKKYVYFIGGNSLDTFLYNTIRKNFEDWGPLKKKKIKPCVALANKCQLYAFDAQGGKNNFEFVERCDLTKGREWEVIKVILSERFPLIDFSSATDYDNKKI